MKVESRKEKVEKKDRQTGSVHGIIMSGANPKLILDRLKTQTRRLPCCTNCLVDGVRWSGKRFKQLDFESPLVFVDKGRSPAGNAGPYLHVPELLNTDGVMHRVYPIWQKWDQLCVREAWQMLNFGWVVYRADLAMRRYVNEQFTGETDLWNPTQPATPLSMRPSIHMFHWMSRILCNVLDVGAERLQDISESECRAEGIQRHLAPDTLKAAYRELWESLHGDGSWAKNPWVFPITFRLTG